MLALDEQSPNIAAGVHINRSIEDLGAGDQVIVVLALFHLPSSPLISFFAIRHLLELNSRMTLLDVIRGE